MLKLDDIRLVEGHQVHGDTDSPQTFYIFPGSPTFARVPSGDLQLRFIEYEQLRTQGEDVFGGFVVFSADLSIPDDTVKKITTALQQEVNKRFAGQQAPTVVIAPINWTGGTVTLLLQEGGALVEKIHGAATPSLYGNNVASFALELSDIGTAVFKNTLSTGANSAITVVYNLEFFGQLPPNKAWGTWHASKFYSFFQTVDIEDNFWSEDDYTETIHSARYNSEVTEIGGTSIDNPNLTPQENAQLSADMLAVVQQQLAAGVERNLLASAADVDPNVKALTEDQDFENVKRTVSNTQISDVRVSFTQSKAIIVKKAPQGQLPSVTALTGSDGKALAWENYYTKISADEFFRTKRVTISVNADFDQLPIHSVVVTVSYPHSTPAKTQKFIFTKADQTEEFESLVTNGQRSVTYSYTVNYQGSAFTFTSKESSEEGDKLIINVDDLGILVLDVAPDGIDFAAVARAQVHVSYAGETPLDKTITLTQQSTTAQLREIIRSPRTKALDYTVTYSMLDGREVVGKPGTVPVGAKTLSVSDPFGAPKLVTFRATGDLESAIAEITVQATYTDPGNNYTQQTSFVLSKDAPDFQWSFPVIDDTVGEVSYTGFISRKDGTTVDIEPTTSTAGVIAVGDKVEQNLVITVDPALLDWNKLKIALVTLAYDDDEGELHLRKDFTFRPDAATPQTWTVPLKDHSKQTYTWTATLFLLDGTRTTVGPTSEPQTTTLFPELPA